MSSMDRIVQGLAASGALDKASRADARRQARKESKAAARKEREQLRIAAAAEIWEDRDGKARPTPQRRLKGVFSLRDGDDAGVSVAVDQRACTIWTLLDLGLIDKRQAEAGEIFEEVARGGIGSPSSRSCIDFSPVGHDGDGDDDAAIRARSRWRSLQRMLSPSDRQECMAVCWQHVMPRSISRLRHALDIVGDWAGLERPQKPLAR